MLRRALASAALAIALTGLTASAALAHPDNAGTLHFVLTCDDGQVWNADLEGGASAFHLDGGQMFVWKQIDYVTPDQQAGTVFRGIQGFSAAPTVTCTYTGAVSGNAYTVTGFYPPAG